MHTIFVLSATQEECLQDIYKGEPKRRGGISTVTSLKRRRLIEFNDRRGCYVVTDLGMSQLQCQWNRKSN